MRPLSVFALLIASEGCSFGPTPYVTKNTTWLEDVEIYDLENGGFLEVDATNRIVVAYRLRPEHNNLSPTVWVDVTNLSDSAVVLDSVNTTLQGFQSTMSLSRIVSYTLEIGFHMSFAPDTIVYSDAPVLPSRRKAFELTFQPDSTRPVQADYSQPSKGELMIWLTFSTPSGSTIRMLPVSLN